MQGPYGSNQELNDPRGSLFPRFGPGLIVLSPCQSYGSLIVRQGSRPKFVFCQKPWLLLTHPEPSDMVPEVVAGRRQGGSSRVRKSPWILLIFVLIGGLLGGILGEILHVMAPQGTIQSIFSTHFTPGINPPLTIDLVLVKLTLGFSIKVNILSILGMFIGVYLYKHV
jgi:hypothetical protein